MPRTKQFDEQMVLERAIDLFWKQGYHATSMQDLVDHLGINRASMYSTFGDKKQLFIRAINQYRTNNTEGLAAFMSKEPDVKVGLRKLLELAVAEAAQDTDRRGCFIVNTATELIPGDPEIQELVKENKQQFEQSMYDYLHRGQEEGQIPAEKDLKSIASLLFTLYNGIRVVGKMAPHDDGLSGAVSAALSLLD